MLRGEGEPCIDADIDVCHEFGRGERKGRLARAFVTCSKRAYGNKVFFRLCGMLENLYVPTTYFRDRIS